MARHKAMTRWILSASLIVLSAAPLAQTEPSPTIVPPKGYNVPTEWLYRQHADIVTGVLTAGATLMSQFALSTPEIKKREAYHAYLTVHRTVEKDQPLEAALSIDSSLSDPKAGDCESECSLRIRFGKSTPRALVATRNPNSLYQFIFKDARAFIAAASSTPGTIEVEYRDLHNRTMRYEFVASKPLEMSKLPKGRASQ